MKLYLKNNTRQLGLELHSLIHIEYALLLKKKQIAFVKFHFCFSFLYQEKIQNLQEKLDSGEILTKVPCFETSIAKFCEMNTLISKKVTACLILSLICYMHVAVILPWIAFSLEEYSTYWPVSPVHLKSGLCFFRLFWINLPLTLM